MIKTGQLIVRDGAQVSASTVGGGQRGGTLAVTASESVQLIGTSPNGRVRSGLLVGTNEGTGSAGDVTIATRNLLVQDGALVSARTSAQGRGGNIMLRVQDLLLLSRNSEISTTAGTTGAGGDGGNIDIDTQFLFAVPSENSDITANAFEGNGGNIQITAKGIFGIEPREQITRLSDITAVSQQNPKLNGVVEINTLDIDPNRGVATLPEELVDAARLIAQQICPAGGATVASSEFIVTGRGGLPPNPSDPLSSDTVWTDLPTTHSAENLPISATATQPTNSPVGQLVEAQGWVINALGEVVLTATAPSVTPHIPWMRSLTCDGALTDSSQ